MPITLDPLLISKTDFDKIRDISINIDDDRLDGFIHEAQTQEIKAFLGEPLYADVVNNPASVGPPDYVKLLDGGDYTKQGETVKFNGLRIVLVYYAWARLVKTNQMNVTRYGVVSKQEGEDSLDIIQAQIEQKVRDARALAVKYQGEVFDFLDENSSEYTLWDIGESDQPRKTSFNFYKV